MQTFTNTFNVAVNESKTEVILNFLQTTPVMNDEHQIIGTESFPVANLVMTGDDARQLTASLAGLLFVEDEETQVEQNNL